MILAATATKQSNPISRMARRGFPELRITHLTAVPSPLGIDDKLNIDITFLPGTSDYSEDELYTGKGTKKGRGNTTWTFSDKKPFNITFTNDAFAKLNFPLFGWPSNSEYSLLADAQDKTHTRTPFGHALSQALGLDWAPRTQKVRVYIDDEYVGFYSFVEKYSDGAGRIALPDKIGVNDISGVELTGDFVVERLAGYQIKPSELAYATVDPFDNNYSYLWKIPDPDKAKPEQIAYTLQVMTDYYDAVLNGDLSDTVNGYRALHDVESLAKAELQSNLQKTGDGMHSNNYFRKMKAGKLDRQNSWDMGGTMGNGTFATYRGSIAAEIPLTDPEGEWIGLIVPEFVRLFTDDYYMAVRKQVFVNAIPKIERLIRDWKAYTSDPLFLQEVAYDRGKWPDILTDEDYIPRGSFANEIAFTQNFFVTRFEWFKDQMGV